MKSLLGTVFTAIITDENEQAYFVQKNGVTFRLDKEEGEHQLGEGVEGFAYINQKQENRFTTTIPKIQVGHYAFGEVVSRRKDLGVFVNIGLPDKDIAVSFDELPSMKELWPKQGDRIMIALTVDEKGRMWGTLSDEKIFRAMARRGKEEQKNHNIKGRAFRLKLVGTYIMTEDYYLGFIHPSERYQEPRLGEEVEGRIIGVRPDGVLNISLRPRAYEAIGDDAQMILAILEKSPDHKIPFTDKSDPDEIKQYFGISKGQFKRALGNLMKQNKITQKEGQTFLNQDSN